MHHKNDKKMSIPIPKTFKDGKDFENIVQNCMHFKSLKVNNKKNILKYLNMEVIILKQKSNLIL